MGRPWWYDSYWERQGKSPKGRLLTNRRNSSTPGCLIFFIVIFILLLFGLAIWLLSGSQTSSLTNPLPAVPEPSQQSPATYIPSSPPAQPPPESALIPDTVKPPVSPSITVHAPTYKHEELLAHALELINNDRTANGLEPVALGSNSAAQKHAEKRLANRFSSHWGMDGLKPYMRYTLAGGENYEAENGFMTETYWIGSRDSSYRRDPKEMLEQAQEELMASTGHRKNILDKWHKKVNLGIAYNNERLDLVQQFEGDYIDFSELPNITNKVLSMSGEVSLGII
jgi:uncharacterized protein YkwD